MRSLVSRVPHLSRFQAGFAFDVALQALKLAEYIENAGNQQETPEDQEAKAKKAEAEEINRQGAILGLQKGAVELAKGQAEVEGQQIENVLAANGIQSQGFVG